MNRATRGMDKCGRQLVELAIALGWTAEKTRRHIRLTSPSGRHRVTMPMTASDHRSMLNARAALRRTGEFDDRKEIR